MVQDKPYCTQHSLFENQIAITGPDKYGHEDWDRSIEATNWNYQDTTRCVTRRRCHGVAKVGRSCLESQPTSQKVCAQSWQESRIIEDGGQQIDSEHDTQQHTSCRGYLPSDERSANWRLHRLLPAPADPVNYESAPPRNNVNCRLPLPDPPSSTASSLFSEERRRRNRPM